VKEVPKALSEDLRERVIIKSNEGKTAEQIVSELNVSQTFVYDMLRLYKQTGSVKAKKPSGGRPPSIDEEGLARIKALLLETPDATLAEIKQTLGLTASISRICDAINYKLNMPYKKKLCLIRGKTGRT